MPGPLKVNSQSRNFISPLPIRANTYSAIPMGGNYANTMFNDISQINIHGGQFIQNVGHSEKGFGVLSREVAHSAFYDAGHDFDLPKCHPNTRVAVLKRIKDWTLNRTNSEASLMWIYGAAGAGKSSIARTVAEWCEEEKIRLASFFFFRSDPLRNNFKRFIATLAYDIIQSVPDCRPIIKRAVELDPHIFARSLNAQFLHLILKPLSQVAHARDVEAGQPLPHVILVDGLDECIESQEQTSIIQLFSAILFQSPLFRWKVLIASRPELAIRHSFNNIANLSTWLALSEEYKAHEDISRYLEDNFREIKRKNPNRLHLPGDWPSKEDLNSLVRKSSGQFIYAVTVIKFLSSGKRIKARLRTILDDGTTPTSTQAELPFRQLDLLYENILKSAGDGQLEAVKQTTALCTLYERCQFQHACTAVGQTPGEIFAGILGLDIEDVDCILEELGSILIVTKDYVRLYHASISDFLFDRDRAGDLWVDEQLCWTKILCHSLRSLFNVPKELSWKEHLPRSQKNDPKEIPWREYWRTILITALQQARPTEEATLCLSSEFTPLFEVDDCIITDDWTIFLNFLRERSLEVDDWKSLCHKHISKYDHWLAGELQSFKLSHPQNIRAAFLSFRPIPDIAFMVFPQESKIRPYLPTPWTRKVSSSGVWMDMFDRNQLPKVKAYVRDGRTQALAVLHCIHFIVDCAVTSRLVRFRTDPDRRKSRPWIWRRRLLATRSRDSPPHIRRCSNKTGQYHSSHASFIPFRLASRRFIPTGPNLKRMLMDGALKYLVVLLNGATCSPHLIFALRMALSLTCTSRHFADVWHKAREATREYLVRVAGLKPGMLIFVKTGHRINSYRELLD